MAFVLVLGAGCQGAASAPRRVVPSARPATVDVPVLVATSIEPPRHRFDFETELPTLGDAVWSTRDIDHDGQAEIIGDVTDGGSGYRSFTRCVGDIATRRWTCVEEQRSAFSLFVLSRETGSVVPSKAAHRRAAGTPICEEPSPGSPSQGALWAPSHFGVSGFAVGELALAGKPQEQQSVCFDVETARRIPGAFGWDPSGIQRNELTPAASVRIIYQPAMGWFLNDDDRRARTSLRMVLETRGYQVFQQRAAVAVYAIAEDRHAWIADYSGSAGDEGVKIDRHEAIRAIEEAKDGFAIHFHPPSSPRVDVTLP